MIWAHLVSQSIIIWLKDHSLIWFLNEIIANWFEKDLYCGKRATHGTECTNCWSTQNCIGCIFSVELYRRKFAIWRKMGIWDMALTLSSVFCCRAGSGYHNGYPILGNSRGGFLAFLVVCDRISWAEFSFSLALFIRCYPLVHSRGRSPMRNLGTRVVAIVPQPSANLWHQQTPPDMAKWFEILFWEDLRLESWIWVRDDSPSAVVME